jgi:hypothetical protein
MRTQNRLPAGTVRNSLSTLAPRELEAHTLPTVSSRAHIAAITAFLKPLELIMTPPSQINLILPTFVSPTIQLSIHCNRVPNPVEKYNYSLDSAIYDNENPRKQSFIVKLRLISMF